MTINQATDLVLYALLEGNHGDLFVYNNKQCNIETLAKAFSDNITYIKERCEEKTDEALLTINELNHSKFEKGRYFRVNKSLPNINKYEEAFTSETAEELTVEELQQMIKESKEMGMF